MKESIVMKLGGSTISPSSEKLFNSELAKKFSDFILQNTSEFNFLIIIGGGYLAKQYQSLFDSAEQKDRAGIIANDTNAKILSLQIEGSEFQIPSLFTGFEKNNPVIFGGSEPGHTGDFVAVELSKRINAKKIILLKDVAGVYTKDPKLDSSATVIEKLSWNEYKNLFDIFEYKPKVSLPIDPIATKFAEENDLSVHIAKSDDFDNLQKILEDAHFEGTIIEK